MIFKLKLIALFLFIGFNSFSQNRNLSGIVKDVSSGKPVSDAHIMLTNGRTTISDSLGFFSISVEKMPVTLRITHLSYGQSDVKVRNWPKDRLVIRIQPMISSLDEIQISAERLRILTKKDDYSLQDFAFDESHLWMIGYVNNHANKGRLFLANQFGDTISSKSIQGAESLYKDVFGQVHIVMSDSVYQLFCTDSSEICLLYPMEKSRFMSIMSPIVAGFSNKLVYRNTIPKNEEVYIYYYDEKKDGPQYLTHIVDSLEAIRKEFDIITGSMWLELKSTRYWMANSKIAKIYEGEVRAPMFSLNNSLFIVNGIKDSLLVYNTEGRFIESVPISFHKDMFIGQVDYKEFKFLPDKSTEKVYILERKTAGWSIYPLDINTGHILPSIPVPNFAGMTKITVYNNAVYFLYYEKHFPYYTRLFRFQL